MKKTKCNLVGYSQIANIKSIDELLPKTLILYQLARVGHFCCIFKDRYGTICFFDPLGFRPDDELNYKQKNFNIPNHDFTYLLQLLYLSKQPICYNEYRYQKDSAQVCGHWCTLRLLYSHLTNKEFYDIFKPIRMKDKAIIRLYNEH